MTAYRWAPWERAEECTDGPEPGARALLAWLYEEYRPPGYSLGIYNCRDVRGASTTSTHGEGRAVDYGLPLAPDGRGNPIGHHIVDRIGPHGARLGVQAIVFDRSIWSAVSPQGRRYDGVHPHHDHLHIELTRAAGAKMTLSTFRYVLAKEPTVPTGRIAGGDRWETAAMVARTAYPHEKHQGAIVWLVRGDEWSPDSIGSGMVAPVLPVPKDGTLPPAIAEAIRAYRPSKVLALGGTGAISDSILEQAGRAGG